MLAGGGERVLWVAMKALDFDVGTMFLDKATSTRRSWPRDALHKYATHLGRRVALALVPSAAVVVLMLYSSVSSLLGYQLLVTTTWYLLNTFHVRVGAQC